MGEPGPAERVGQRALGGRDAERGRSRRRAARVVAERLAGDDLHRLAGPAADDPEHVQDRRRADLGGASRRGPVARSAGAVDLRRPLRRDGGAPDGVCAARLGVGARGARPRPRRAGRDARDAGPVRPFLRRVPNLPRAQHRRDALRRRPACAGARGAGAGTSRSRALARAAVHPRHGSEPGRVLPGARDGEPLLRARAGCRRSSDGEARRAHRPPLPRRGLHRAPGGRPRARGDGIGGRDDPGDRGVAQRAWRARRGDPGAALPAVPGAGAARSAARDGSERRRPRPDEGARVAG